MSLTNEQYDLIMRGYNERVQRNEQIVRERKRTLYLSIPQLTEIDREISSKSVATAKRMMHEEAGGLLKELHEQIEQLTREKIRLMKEAGYGEDYLDPPYQCKDCKDTGYIGTKRCHCFSQAAIDLVYTGSHLKERTAEHNFDRFSLDYYRDDIVDEKTGVTPRENAKNAIATAKEFVRDFDRKNNNLLIYGKPGTSKTFLSDCIAKDVLDAGYTVIYLTAFSLFDTIEKGVFSKKGKPSKDYNDLFDCELLIIDDLGTEFSNSLTNSQLFSCINERLIKNKSTIISTNLDLGEISETYTERLFSRFVESYTLIRMFGEDIRILKKLKQS